MTTASPAVWTFARDDDDVIVLRCPSPTTLIVSSPARPGSRRIQFANVLHRLQFQSGFEAHLLDTGWTLVSFAHSDRASRDRWWRRWFRQGRRDRWWRKWFKQSAIESRLADEPTPTNR